LSIASRLWVSAVSALVLLGALAIAILWVVHAMDVAATARRDARQALLDTELVLSALSDAETGQRGYLLTGLDRYLEPYQAATASITDRLAALTAAGQSIPQIRARAAELDRVANAKLAELREAIAARHDQGFEAAEEIVATDRGKQLMDRARALVGEIEGIQTLIIDQRDAELERLHGILQAVLIFGTLVAAVSALVTRRLVVGSIQRPLDALGAGMARIAAGDLDRDIEVTGKDELGALARSFNAMLADLRAARLSRHQARDELDQSNAALQARTRDLERRTLTINLLGRLANRLPASANEQEFVEVVQSYAPQLLPGTPGALYTITESHNLLQRVGTWGDPAASSSEFTPSQCWGLRRGQPHCVEDPSHDIVCSHVQRDHVTAYRCLPLVAQGETVGLLYLEGRDGPVIADEADLGVLTETIAFSLVNQRLRERLRNQSIRDPLTSLFNRRYLEESLELECSRADRTGSAVSLIMADIDHFKHFNDTFGHEAGDAVLKAMAELLKRLVRQGDVACRFGGEEFILVLPGTSTAEAAALADRIRLALHGLELSHHGQALGNVTSSFGVASYPAAGLTPDELIEAVDHALYAAKTAGRDCVKQAEAPVLRAAQ